VNKTKKSNKLLSLLLALTLLVSLSGVLAMPAMAAGPETPITGAVILALPLGTTEYETGVDISGLPSDWTVASPNMTPNVVDNGNVTMTVGGVETQIADGTFSGDVVFTVTQQIMGDGSAVGQGPPPQPVDNYSITGVARANYPSRYRTGLYFDETGLVADKSVLSAVDESAGTVDTDAQVIDGISITSGDRATATYGSPQFSGIIFNGNSNANVPTPALDYTIKNSTIDLFSNSDGNPWSTSDFTGLGTALIAANGARVTLENVDIHTTGVTKSSIITAAGSILLKNSTLTTDGGTLYNGYRSGADFNRMMSPPWVLGIGGNARGANLLGNNSVQGYVDSNMTSTGWAVLSTDSGSNGVVTAINSNLTMTGHTGYGIYAIGGATENFYGCNFDVATYPVIMTGCGGVTFQPYTQGQGINIGEGARGFSTVTSLTATVGTTPCRITSQFGFMAHQGDNPLSLIDTELTTKNAAFLCKTTASSGGPGGPGGPASLDATVDGGTINSADKTLVQVIDNDDPPIGIDMTAEDAYGPFGMPCFNTYFVEKAGWPTAASADSSGGFTGTFTNIALNGNMYNASGYQYSTRDENSGDISTSDATPQNMDVTLGAGATLNGVISTSHAVHVWMVWQDAANTQGGYYRYATPADAATITSLNNSDPAFPGGRTYNVMNIDGTDYLQATSYRESDYYNQGHVVNQVGAFNNATANVTLKDGAVWTPTGTCYLTGLDIDATSVIAAPAGYTLSMTVDGVDTTIATLSSLSGEIVLQLTAIPGGGSGSGTTTTPPATLPAYQNPFGDISPDAWYYEAVQYVNENGLMIGISDSEFAPNLDLTRAMVITVLYRHAGEPDVGAYGNPFRDVPDGKYYTDAVIWGYQNGIINGYGADMFGPNDFVTRQDLAVILSRYADFANLALPQTVNYSGFDDDSSIAGYAKDAVVQLYEAGVIQGKPGNLFDPRSDATRAEFATMIMRFLTAAEPA